MEMIDYSKSNEFLKYTYDLFEEVYLNREITTEKRLVRKFPKKYVTVEINKPADEAYEAAKQFCRKIKLVPPSFQDLFDFGTYIKCMEKVFFYKNDMSAIVCCDSNLQDKTTRKIIFNLNDLSIVFKLEKLNRVDEYIDIIVTRNFGKKMESKFTVKNQQMQYNDCNDLMLTNTINIILETMISDYFMMIIDSIYHETILSPSNIGHFYRNIDISLKDVNKDEA